MSKIIREKTTVVAVGGGASGLTLGNMLHHIGVGCIVLEKRSRQHVELRQRAGIVELRAVRMFHRWEMGDVIVGPPYMGTTELRVDGVSRQLTDTPIENDPSQPPARFCPQQALVRNLLAKLVDRGGDLRFEVDDVKISGVDGDHPVVSYVDKDGVTHEIECDYVAGCDGDHGVSRSAIPSDVLKTYEEEYDAAWVSILADVPPPKLLQVVISQYGYACHIGRGPQASRFYIQCPKTDTAEDWSDEKVWQRLRQCVDDPNIATGPITEKSIVYLRSVVHEPMSYGRLFLIGDAAHLIVPVGGKGMNLALRDAELFALAVQDKVRNGNDAGLKGYSEACLRRVWNYQEFALSWAEVFHDGGDITRPFRRKIARTRLERLYNSPTALRLYSEMMMGVD